MTDADNPRAEAAADIRDDAPRADPGDHSPLAFPAHLLPVEADEDAEVILEEVIPAPDDGKTLRPRREARETALVLLYEAEARGVDPREVLDAQIVTPLNYTVALLSASIHSVPSKSDAATGGLSMRSSPAVTPRLPVTAGAAIGPLIDRSA